MTSKLSNKRTMKINGKNKRQKQGRERARERKSGTKIEAMKLLVELKMKVRMKE